MARDAQMSGDRVQTEYYLQYADHYYRVLNENRARFEEQRPQRGEYYEEDEDQDEGVSADGRDDGEERSYREDRPARDERPVRQDRPYRDERGDRDDRPYRSEQQGQRDAQNAESDRPRPDRDVRNGDAGRGRGRPRRDRFETAEGDERIALDVLPPAISAVPAVGNDVSDEQPAKTPRRRARRPRDDDDSEIAPAA
jgi:hypothetical protein